MLADWNLHDGWDTLCKQIKDAHMWIMVDNYPIVDKETVDAAMHCIMKTGLISIQYKT